MSTHMFSWRNNKNILWIPTIIWSNGYYCRIVSPSPATYDQLTVFHDPEYIDFLKKITDIDDEEKYDEEAQQFGLSM